MKAAWRWVTQFYDQTYLALYRKSSIISFVASIFFLIGQQAHNRTYPYEWATHVAAYIAGFYMVLMAIKIVHELIKWIIQTVQQRIRVGYW